MNVPETIGDVVVHDTSEVMGIGDNMRHYCTRCSEIAGHRGGYGGFLHGIPGNLRVSGTIGDVIVHDTSEVMGIGDNMRHCCTRCPEIAEHWGRYGGFLDGIPGNLRASGRDWGDFVRDATKFFEECRGKELY